MRHEYYMKKVFEFARQGAGMVSPNPLVGAIIVKDNKIISTGFHKKYGTDHAELDAIKGAKESLYGAVLYCNLEPCCHTNKKTPPCAQRIIAERFSKVVIANKDPNPLVNGLGIVLLKQAGIEVIENICTEQGEQLNESFFTYQRKKRPYICLKYAQTLDGNIACTSGDSKWISDETCRKKVHQMRAEYDAVLIGVGTLIADDPHLTIRDYASQKKCPFRVILGSLGFIRADHTVVADSFADKTLLVTSVDDYQKHEQKAQKFKERGISIITVDAAIDDLDINQVMQKLYDLSITSVLVEGGSKILTSFVKQNLYDRLCIFIAPKMLGAGLKAIDNLAIAQMKNAITFKNGTYEIIGECINFNATNICS